MQAQTQKATGFVNISVLRLQFGTLHTSDVSGYTSVLLKKF